jgi:SAM-dependent methyltransferase
MDAVGHSTLDVMEKADRYNLWLTDIFGQYLHGRMLEIGCGIGTITQYYVDRFDVTASDMSDEYVKIVRDRFCDRRHFGSMILDIEKPLPPAQKKFNSIVCSNVLEHIKDDVSALNNMYELLEPAGTLVLLVPACGALYGEMDKNLGHYRRYSKKDLIPKLDCAGFTVEKQFYVNVFGALGWYFRGRILKRKTLDTGSMALFNVLAPFFILFEKLFKPWFGLSLVSVCQKRNQNNNSSAR